MQINFSAKNCSLDVAQLKLRDRRSVDGDGAVYLKQLADTTTYCGSTSVLIQEAQTNIDPHSTRHCLL